MNSIDKSREYFPFLENIRGIAILLVLFVHSVIFVNFVSKQGDLGVSIFFSLSGFLLSHISCQKLYYKGYYSIRFFWQKRAKRLLPAATIFSLLIVLLNFLYSNNIYELFRLSILMINFDIYSNQKIKFLGHTWALSAELQYYLLFSFVILIFNRLQNKEITGKAKILFFSYTHLLLFVVLFLLSAFFWYYYPVFRSNYKFLPFTSLFQISLGAFFGSSFFALCKLDLNPFKSALINKILRHKFCLYANLLVVLGISMFSPYPITKNPWTTILFSILSCSLIFQCAIEREIAYVPTLILKNSFITALGRLSYSLYLYHYPINQVRRKIFEELGIQAVILSLKEEMILAYYLADSFQYFSEIMISILLAYLSFNYVERYFYKSPPVKLFGR